MARGRSAVRRTDARGANAPDDNDRLDLGQVRRIAIGMNSDTPDNRLEISEAYLVGPWVEAK